MVEKSLKKLTKKVKKNEASDTGIFEAELGGEDEVIDGSKISENEDVNERKADGMGGNYKQKKKKKKRVREDSNEGNVEREKVNEQDEEIGELGGGQHSDRNVTENEHDKRRGNKKASGDSAHELQKQQLEDAEGNGWSNMQERLGNKTLNGKVEGKSLKKARKVKKNEVSDTDTCEVELGGEDEVVDGSKSYEKEVNERKPDGIGGDDEKKKKKEKRVREDNNKGNVEKEKVNEQGVEIGELGGGQHSDRNLVEKVKCNKRRAKDKAIGDSGKNLQRQELEDAKGNGWSNVPETPIIEIPNGKDVEIVGRGTDGDTVENGGKKKRKKEKKKDKVDSSHSQQESVHLTEDIAQEDTESRTGKDFETFKMDKDIMEKEETKMRKREKRKEIGCSFTERVATVAENYTEDKANSNANEKGDINLKHKNNTGKRKEAKLVEHDFEDPKRGKGKKKVRFSNKLEVFPPSDDPYTVEGMTEETLVRGKRFSKEEDEIVKQAVYNYIEANCLGEEGLRMVLNCRSHPKIRNCWKEIGACIPYRPYTAVYYRAQILFRRSEKRKWTDEEYEMIRNFHKQHGSQWKVLADELGKHRFHVKDTWRRIRYSKLSKGHWSQEEYQALFDLVNTDLQMKYSEEKKSKYGMLRDNICWTAISDKLSTRSDATCCVKWYKQLTSPMVADGEWADADDYRLIDALYQLDASCPEDVTWDNLLDHRSGDICRKRWNQMVLHTGHHRNKSFAEQVEVLAKRYCPDLLEAREAWDNKPVMP